MFEITGYLTIVLFVPHVLDNLLKGLMLNAFLCTVEIYLGVLLIKTSRSK